MRKRDEKRPWRGAGAGGGRTVAEDVGRDEVALVGCGAEGLLADIPRIIAAFDDFLLVLR